MKNFLKNFFKKMLDGVAYGIGFGIGLSIWNTVKRVFWLSVFGGGTYGIMNLVVNHMHH